MQFKKMKSVAKTMYTKGPQLEKLIMDTLGTCADLVGSTLGPGGNSVLIEKQENMPPMVTKDGVTVFQNIGFQDSTAQTIAESVRDAAVRTASEAGDGPQPLWSKVLTPTGFVTMGEVVPGMEVCGTNGSIQTVLGVFPKGQKEICKVYFSEQRIVECCEDHLWTTVDSEGVTYTLTTKNLALGMSSGRQYATPRLSGGVDKIEKIEVTGVFTEMRCIKVSNPDSLYVTDGFVLTHNTTTSTILAHSFAKAVFQYCRTNPKVSPQRVVRSLEKAFKETLEPNIKNWRKLVKFDDSGKKYLRAVAKVSANGDEALADAVLECFELVGDDGNVTILEFSGPSKYEVERLDGYGVGIGFEDSCGPFYSKFLNDPKTQSAQLENPVFVLYYGRVQDVGLLAPIFEKIIEASKGKVPNVVVAATGFSEVVLGQLAINFAAPNHNLAVYPLLVPMSPIKTGQLDFLMDLSALTGSKVLDPLNSPLDQASAMDLGSAKHFESTRFRSNIIIDMDDETEARVIQRAEDVNEQLKSIAVSDLEKSLLRERIGKLTGGIAKLKVIGSSSGELREKRDRAEDAICAVRGAINHGVLPAGGWTLLKLIDICKKSGDDILVNVVAPALFGPVERLYLNAGYTSDELIDITNQLTTQINSGSDNIYDLLESKIVDAYQSGLLDSTPAVLEALRNSISIASQIGTTGGTIVFQRDGEFENMETREHNRFMQDLNQE